MSVESTNALLNRLLVIHYRSLPMYLGYAGPWLAGSNGRAGEVLAGIVEAQRRTYDRIGELILRRHGEMSHGEFPMSYTSLHDLSFDYLLNQLIRAQERDIALIKDCASQLTDAESRALAEEALGEAKAHLDSLQELRGA